MAAYYQVKIVPCKTNGKYNGHMKQIAVKDGEFIVGELCPKCGIRKKIDGKIERGAKNNEDFQNFFQF